MDILHNEGEQQNSVKESSPTVSPLKRLSKVLPKHRTEELWVREFPRVYRFWANYASNTEYFSTIGELDAFVKDRMDILIDFSEGKATIDTERALGGQYSRDTVYVTRRRGEKLLDLVLKSDEKDALGIIQNEDPEMVRVRNIYKTYKGLEKLITAVSFADSKIDELFDENPQVRLVTRFLQEGYSLQQLLNYLGIRTLASSTVSDYEKGLVNVLIKGEPTAELKVSYFDQVSLAYFLRTEQDCRGFSPGYKVSKSLKAATEGFYVSSRGEGPFMRNLAIFARILPLIHYCYLTDELTSNEVRLKNPARRIFPGAKVNGKIDIETVDLSEYYEQFVTSENMQEGIVPDPLYFLAQDIISGKGLDYLTKKVKQFGVTYAYETLRKSISAGIVFFKNILLSDVDFMALPMEKQKEIIRRNRRDTTYELFIRVADARKKLKRHEVASILSTSSRLSRKSS